MRRLLRFELRRALASRWFLVPLLAGCVLVVASSLLDAASYDAVRGYVERFGTTKSYAISSYTAFSLWAGVDYQPPSLLLFTLAPLLALVPFAWSQRSDLSSGYSAMLYVRAGRRDCYVAKFAATFLSAGLVVAAPLVLSLLLGLCIAPAALPQIRDLLTLSLTVSQGVPFYELFYTAPLGFVAVWITVDFALAGLWAVAVMAVSLLVPNRVTLMVGAFLAQVALRYVVGLATMLSGERLAALDLSTLMLPTTVYDGLQWLATTLMLAALAVVSIALPARLLGRDVL